MKLSYKKTVILSLLIILVLGGLFFFLRGGGDKQRAEEQKVILSEEGVTLGSDFLRYTNEKYNFSLDIPKNLDVEIVKEANADVYVFQGKDEGFQIYITPLPGIEGVPTKEFVTSQVPGVHIEGPQEVVLGDNIHALIFISEDPSIGKTRETWFVQNEHLYQVTTFFSYDVMLARILGSLDFK